MKRQMRCIMKFLNKMERKFGKYAIQNLTFWLIGFYVLGYIIEFTMPNVVSYLTLEPYYIMHGEVWRLISWILIPPSTSMIFLIFMLMCYYFIGISIERVIGTFRYNVYMIGGILLTAISAMALYGINYWITGKLLIGIGGYYSTNYINMSLFLTFAVLFPNVQFQLYFLIPIRAKWMGLIEFIWAAFSFISGNLAERVAILASLANFLIFYLSTRNYNRVSPKEIHRKQVYRQQMRQPQGVTRHKCAICGRTEKDGDNLEFRFCSKCEGNYEYCQDHLFTHQHIKRS